MIPRSILLPGGLLPFQAMRETGLERAVLKPCWDGGGLGVDLIDRDNVDAEHERLVTETGGRAFMMRESLPEIGGGEIPFVFIAGSYAHAVLKQPAEGEFRVNSRYKPPPPSATSIGTTGCRSSCGAGRIRARNSGEDPH